MAKKDITKLEKPPVPIFKYDQKAMELILSQIAGTDVKVDKKQQVRDTIKKNIAIENGPTKVDRMLRLNQIKTNTLNYEALKPKKPGIPRVSSQKVRPINETLILPVSAKHNRAGYFPMMITSKVEAAQSEDMADVPICHEDDLARKQAMHLAIKQNVNHLLRKSATLT